MHHGITAHPKLSLSWVPRMAPVLFLTNWMSTAIPYDNIFNLGPSMKDSKNARCTFIQATVLTLALHSLTLSCAVPELGVEKDGMLCFDNVVYTLGSRLPMPLDLWDYTSELYLHLTPGCEWDAPGHANTINGKPAILHAPYAYAYSGVHHVARGGVHVGGRGRGIGDSHPSRQARHAPALVCEAATAVWWFGGWSEGGDGEGGEESGGMHAEILQVLHALNVHVVLGERVDLSALSSLAPSSSNSDRTTMVRTTMATTPPWGSRQRHHHGEDDDREGDWEIGADLDSSCSYTSSFPAPLQSPPSLLANIQPPAPSGQTPNTALLRVLDPHIIVVFKQVGEEGAATAHGQGSASAGKEGEGATRTKEQIKLKHQLGYPGRQGR
ncbi:hypothetical protein B0H13DRAFT_1890352 [Mycena leptocephala]|nr:hypothetical protein B0H13DRAFT_1890352 [Mycena leptocephala]